MKWMEEYKQYFKIGHEYDNQSLGFIPSLDEEITYEFDDPPQPPPANRLSIGGSVIGVKFDKGVVLAADNMISFGHLGRHHKADRIEVINNKTIIGAFGSFPDFQNVQHIIKQNAFDNLYFSDGHVMQPKSLYHYMTNLFHLRRSHLKPLLVNTIVGGINDDGSIFLGTVDLHGTGFLCNEVAAVGLSRILVKTTMADMLKLHPKVTQNVAMDVIKKGMELLFYRDTHAMGKYTVGLVTQEGSQILGPYVVNQDWTIAANIKGF